MLDGGLVFHMFWHLCKNGAFCLGSVRILSFVSLISTALVVGDDGARRLSNGLGNFAGAFLGEAFPFLYQKHVCSSLGQSLWSSETYKRWGQIGCSADHFQRQQTMQPGRAPTRI